MSVQIPALGRDVRLGMLFDCRRNTFLENIIFSDSVIASHTTSTEHYQSDYDFSTEDSISEKNKLLDINGSAKMSILSGAIAAEGSLTFLDDHRQYTRQSRVLFKLSCRTHFDELSQSGLGSSLKDVRRRKLVATHFVTGIQYGADAIMVFDQNVSKSHDFQLSKAELQARVMFLVTTSKCTERKYIKRSSGNKINCKYHGDIKLNETPKTFEEAVGVCKTLSARVNKHNAKPMTVWLRPLSALSRQEKEYKITTKDTKVVKEVECKFEKYQCLKRKCNDILKDYGKLCKTNVGIREKLLATKKNVIQSEIDFKSNLQKAVKDFTMISNIRAVTDVSETTELQTTLQEEIDNHESTAKIMNSFVKKINPEPNNEHLSIDANKLQYSLDIQLPSLRMDCLAKSKNESQNDKTALSRKDYMRNLREMATKVLSFRKCSSELTMNNFVFDIKTTDSDDNLKQPSLHKLTEKEIEEKIALQREKNNEITSDEFENREYDIDEMNQTDSISECEEREHQESKREEEGYRIKQPETEHHQERKRIIQLDEERQRIELEKERHKMEQCEKERNRMEQCEKERLRIEQLKEERRRAEQLEEEQQRIEQQNEERGSAEQLEEEQQRIEQQNEERKRVEQLEEEQQRIEQENEERRRAKQLEEEQQRIEQLKKERRRAEQLEEEQQRIEQQNEERRRAKQLEEEQQRIELERLRMLLEEIKRGRQEIELLAKFFESLKI